MATVPGSVLGDGQLSVLWVPTIATPTAPKLTELNAVSTVDLSCYVTLSGFAPATSEAVVNDDRLCGRETFEAPGRIANTLELTYVYDPQSTVATANAAYVTLVRGTKGYIVCRWGLPFDQVKAIGDLVDVWPVTCGDRRKQPVAANEVLKAMQKMFVRATVIRDAACVA